MPGNQIRILGSSSAQPFDVYSIALEDYLALPTATAATNTTAVSSALAQALAQGGGLITLNTPGTYTVTDTFTAPANTVISLGPGVTLQVAGGGAVTTLQAMVVKTWLVGGTVIVVTGSRALTNADNGATLVNNGASNYVLTVPAGLIAAFGCVGAQNSTGTLQFTGSVAVVHNVSGFTTTSGQYAVLALIATGTDTYLLTGSGV